MGKIALLVMLLFSFSMKSKSLYYFTAQKEGIHNILLPINFDLKDFHVSFNKSKVVPYIISQNELRVYCPHKGKYQIIKGYKKHNAKIRPFEKISEKNDYVYPLNNSMNLNHWFHKIVTDKKSFKIKIEKGKYMDENKFENLTFKLYNFSEGNTPIIFKINGKEYIKNIRYKEDQDINFSIKDYSNLFNIEVLPLTGRIGIKSIYYSTNSDRKILETKNFEKYTFSVPLKELKTDDRYKYYGINEKGLNYLDKNSTNIKSFLIQKEPYKAQLKVINDLKNVTSGSSIVLYNSFYYNQNNINSLNELLQKIAPFSNTVFFDVNDIYNHYSNSIPSADGLKKFLHSKQPKYVLILGDASESEEQSIPCFYYIQDKGNTRIETDYSYTYKVDPSKPKFSIGRLPFNSSIKLNQFIKKTKVFLNKQSSKYSIYDDISAIEVNNLKTKWEIKYRAYSDQNIIKKYLKIDPIIPFINETNPKIFQFSGHASYTGWSKNHKVEISDFESLETGNLFVLIDLSCWTGTFSYYKRNSFAENLLELENKGAISTLCSSGYTQIRAYNHITKKILTQNGRCIGDVINKTKGELFENGILSLDDIHAYNLLGIPTLKL